ncbi:hypothetical protein Areg01_28600 [Actinoplanes regularis]|nr:hypothetical protein Areg01_28600 [Actinoplanes regularis]
MENRFGFTRLGGSTVNRIDVVNVDTFKTGSDTMLRSRSNQTARSWHGRRDRIPDSPAAPPRTVGAKE